MANGEITNETELRSVYAPPVEVSARKVIDVLDEHCRAFIGASPFLCLATTDGEGRVDVSPRGDPAGFVQVLDEKRLAIPDRIGNNRIDSLRNLLENPRVGLVFFVPGRDDTLRVSGRARIVVDEDLRASAAVKGKAPQSLIVVEVEEVFVHCGRALRRAGLWPDVEPVELPSFATILAAHARRPDITDEMVERADAELY
jgi:PPOX class probable FMN-dependent enzyme